MSQDDKQYILPLNFFEDNERIEDHSQVISNNSNMINPEDRAFHDWYRFVLSYPPHLVRDYIYDFDLPKNSVILDPFCGTGTTLIEAKLKGINAIGLESNPFPQFASKVKTDWKINPDELREFSLRVIDKTYKKLSNQGINDQFLLSKPNLQLLTLNEKAAKTLIKNSISPLPLHKTLVLLEQINKSKDSPVHAYGILALGNALVKTIGNLRFGPEVGVGKIKHDIQVVSAWSTEINKMIADLQQVNTNIQADTKVYLNDARNPLALTENSIDAIITSPPYPNEKDYTRTTRLESVVLGFITDKMDLRNNKKLLLRSNTRGVYKVDNDDQWIDDHENIQRLAAEIEARRIELGKTSGFEKLYARVTKLYFGGMARHLFEMKRVLRPGAKLAYVVGDQASYLRIMIKTGQILAEIAEQQGYKVERIDLFRTRFATATRNELREEVLVLTWPG